MRVFMIGGTGLLGSAAAQLFIDRGHSVRTVALPPLPPGAPIPEEMDIRLCNYFEMTDDEVLELMDGCDCFVFAAGVDERVEFPAPVYEAYKKYNIDPLNRLIPLAKKAGITKTVVLGSYFSYFAKKYPAMRLTEKHPYIRSRIDQEQTALSYAGDDMDVSILELPYIFGTQPGRKPVWVILIEQLKNMGPITFYPKGGTAMLTVRQVAEVIVGAAERSKGGKAYPISCYNYTWNDFLRIVHEAMGVPNRKIINITRGMFKLFGLTMRKQYKDKGIESGIDPVGLADIMCMNAFIDDRWAKSLGATDDDIRAAIFDSVKLSVEAFEGNTDLIGMKGE